MLIKDVKKIKSDAFNGSDWINLEKNHHNSEFKEFSESNRKQKNYRCKTSILQVSTNTSVGNPPQTAFVTNKVLKRFPLDPSSNSLYVRNNSNFLKLL